MEKLPQHLKKYVVEQDYEKYTPRDHAVWRFILRQLKSFLSIHAHQSYLSGLEKTGIEVERIPKISDISRNLEKFGWRALPVSGFIPPAAFMEMQSLGVLPIASDMRSINHLLYTPAPDIVHEAAGHAPFLADAEYADYLRRYAQVAKKAIISREDLELYEAIRELSDIKENPQSAADEILAAEKNLQEKSQMISFVSEAAELSRMNWWTAEYGLVGDLHNPRIFGAGLLSSVGESQWCLSDKVRKIPLTVDCVKQSYDITEPQPQLFVARDFHHLKQVLEDLSVTMAYKTGGAEGLKKAIQAETVNTVELENGIQLSGLLKSFKSGAAGEISYLQFGGPTQICFQGRQLAGHGKDYHSHGYGTPLGPFTRSEADGITTLKFDSGVEVRGKVINTLQLSDTAALLSFDQATCKLAEEILFLPEWGTFDIVTGSRIRSVYAGPADRGSFGDLEDFVAKRVQPQVYGKAETDLFENYRAVRDLRENGIADEREIIQKFDSLAVLLPDEWLLFVEMLEMSIIKNCSAELVSKIESHLNKLVEKNSTLNSQIASGIRLAYEKF